MALTKNHNARIHTIRAAITRTKEQIARLEAADIHTPPSWWKFGPKAWRDDVNFRLELELATLRKLREKVWYANR